MKGLLSTLWVVAVFVLVFAAVIFTCEWMKGTI